MKSNKSYIGISFVILIFGIYAVPKIISKLDNNQTIKSERLDISSASSGISADLVSIGKVPSFRLTNQNQKLITNQFYQGKVYVVEFFFSTCPTICPKMNASMLAIEKSFFGNPNFGIASFTINPDYDTPTVLKTHADLLGVTSTNWNFLTGDKATIMDLSNKGFNLYAAQNEKVAGGFEHSGLFALVDKQGMIRCRKDANGNPIIYYDGLDKLGVKEIQEDIKKLLKE
jgi:protein SCO1